MVSPGTVVLAVINGKDARRSFTVRHHWFPNNFAFAEARGWLRQSQSVPPGPVKKDLLQQRSDHSEHWLWSGELHLPVRRSCIRPVANSQPWSGHHSA